MHIAAATASDLEPAVGRLVAAFAQDPITGFLLQTGPHYRERLARFFSLLMGARVALGMPVLVGRDAAGIRGAAMGYSTVEPTWPDDLAQAWDRFEQATPGMSERMATYGEIAEKCMPTEPHYYLGVIGVDPAVHGRGLGAQLLESFCDLSAADRLSCGVYLETANPSNVRFYERARFEVTGQGRLGSSTLWCMFRRHRPRDDA